MTCTGFFAVVAFVFTLSCTARAEVAESAAKISCEARATAEAELSRAEKYQVLHAALAYLGADRRMTPEARQQRASGLFPKFKGFLHSFLRDPNVVVISKFLLEGRMVYVVTTLDRESGTVISSEGPYLQR